MRETIQNTLEKIVFQNQETLLRTRPEYETLLEEAELLRQRVKKKCGGNQKLVCLINDLLDSYVSIKEYENKFRLLLGVQIGLELGSIDLLPQDIP